MSDNSFLNEIDVAVFPSEHKRLTEIINNYFNDICPAGESLPQPVNDLLEEYVKLIKQTAKLVRISDNTQQKLRNARQKLEIQNEIITRQVNELDKANTKIITELKRAADYVRSIIPKPAYFEKFSIKADWSFIPSLHLGGDLLGYKVLDENNMAFYLLDVCGHGVRSALHSVSVVNTINNAHLKEVDYSNPAKLLDALNRVFNMRDNDNLYFTIWYGVYNKNTRILEYCAAGHPPAFLLDSYHILTRLGSNNFFIGLMKETSYENEQVEIAGPANLIIYSDGAYEIPTSTGEIMTLDKFADLIYDSFKKNENIHDIYEKLIRLYDDNPLDDDFSILKISFR